MKIYELMKEYKIEMDDVRWFLSLQKARDLATKALDPVDLVVYVHSKELEADLYDMEQRYLDEVQSQWDLKRFDEADVREVLYRINREKNRRREKRWEFDFGLQKNVPFDGG